MVVDARAVRILRGVPVAGLHVPGRAVDEGERAVELEDPVLAVIVVVDRHRRTDDETRRAGTAGKDERTLKVVVKVLDDGLPNVLLKDAHGAAATLEGALAHKVQVEERRVLGAVKARDELVHRAAKAPRRVEVERIGLGRARNRRVRRRGLRQTRLVRNPLVLEANVKEPRAALKVVAQVELPAHPLDRLTRDRVARPVNLLLLRSLLVVVSARTTTAAERAPRGLVVEVVIQVLAVRLVGVPLGEEGLHRVKRAAAEEHLLEVVLAAIHRRVLNEEFEARVEQIVALKVNHEKEPRLALRRVLSAGRRVRPREAVAGANPVRRAVVRVVDRVEREQREVVQLGHLTPDDILNVIVLDGIRGALEPLGLADEHRRSARGDNAVHDGTDAVKANKRRLLRAHVEDGLGTALGARGGIGGVQVRDGLALLGHFQLNEDNAVRGHVLGLILEGETRLALVEEERAHRHELLRRQVVKDGRGLVLGAVLEGRATGALGVRARLAHVGLPCAKGLLPALKVRRPLGVARAWRLSPSLSRHKCGEAHEHNKRAHHFNVLPPLA
eukprot:Opistho-1_new@79797